MKELEQYHQIGTVEECREAMNLKTVKKVESLYEYFNYTFGEMRGGI